MIGTCGEIHASIDSGIKSCYSCVFFHFKKPVSLLVKGEKNPELKYQNLFGDRISAFDQIEFSFVDERKSHKIKRGGGEVQ